MPLSAQAFTGWVVAVTDGNTLMVEHGGKRQQVRIFGIAAPELDQPGGDDATFDLDNMIYGQMVKVEPPPGEDSFPRSQDRIMARVADMQGHDVGLNMIKFGDAWADDHWHPPASYDQAMKQAAHAKLDLWALPSPIPPWDWRRLHRR